VQFPISVVTMALSCITSEILVENRDFFIPLAFDAPVRGSSSEYYHPVWYGKSRMVLLAEGEKNFDDMLRVTEGLTVIVPRHSPSYAHAARGKNLTVFAKVMLK